jgi:Fe-S-cluster-containing dehydrogenase component
VAQGELPACIDACPEDVQTIGPRDEIIEKAHEIAEEISGYVYGETENGGTNTIYVSPIPFEELNKAIEKGKGKPHLAAAADAMAQGNNLAAAMLIAPLAGAAAAVGKYFKLAKKGEQAE